jgi:hypothetical protein
MFKRAIQRLLPLFLTIVALSFSLLQTLPWLQSFGWWALTIQLPGTMLLLLICREEDDLSLLELLILGGAIGFGLTTIMILVISFTISPINITWLLVIFGGLTVVLAIWLGLDSRRAAPGVWRQMPRLRNPAAWFGIIVIALLIVTHLYGLGYSEYQGDELDAIEPSWQILAGNPTALLSHHRGPTQSLVAASFAQLLNSYPEGPMRLPYALAGLWAAGALYLLTQRLFGNHPALIALALYALEGLTLGFSRILQYQGILFLVQIAPLLSFVRFSRARNSYQALRWLTIGAFLLGYAYLTHYEALFIGLVAIPLLWQGRRTLSGRMLWGWSLAALLFLLMAFYYVPFFMATSFTDTAQHYQANRIGLGNFPHNNLDRFIAANLFYNSLYFLLVMAIGFLAGLWLAMRTAFKRAGGAILTLLIIGLAILWGGGREASDLTIVTGFLLSLPTIVAVIFIPGTSLKYCLLGIWFFSYWLTYNTLISAPDLHFYELVAPWTIWASVGLAWVGSQIPKLFWRPVTAGAAAIWLLLATYPLLAFVMVQHELLLTFSDTSPLRFWTPISQRATSVALFGVPHREGWAAIGALYRDGTLNGDYKSNGGNVVPRWYIGARASSQDFPTYLFVTDYPFRANHQTEVELLLSSGQYGLIAQLQAPSRIVKIYKLNPPGNPELKTWDLIDMLDRYQQTFDLNEEINVQKNATHWVSAARVIRLFAAPGNKVEVHPAAALPLLLTSDQNLLSFEPAKSGSGWQIQGRRQSATQNNLIFGNVTIIPPPDQPISGLFQTNFQAGIRLVAATVTPELRSNQLIINFAWSRWAAATVPHDYTVFAHLLDGSGNLTAQLDREIETGERKLWQREVDEVVTDQFVLALPPDLPAGSYPLVIGIYYWKTGEHLAALSPTGEPGDSFLWLGDLQVQPETTQFNYAGAY